MCGIAGRAGPFAGWDSEPALQALGHRGPDATGAEEVDVNGWWCAVAHSRLAINDLTAAGNQPLYNDNRSIALVFNGEIYNSPELRDLCEARGHTFSSRSDGEVIVHLWEDEGVTALRRLNGIFALALHDRRNGSIVLARDPLGVKPLFWTSKGETLWFASELRALEAAGAPMGGADVTALAQFLTFLWIPDPRTPYAAVRSLVPGTALSWRCGEHRISTYSNPVLESAAEAEISLATAHEEFPERFHEAVQRQMLSDVPVALMASGGIDSSLIWAAGRASVARAYTLDWSASRGNERLHEDADSVRTLQRGFGTPVTFVPGDASRIACLPESGDLFADPAVELCRQLASAARSDGHKVLLSGQGGDELFCGYRRHILGPWAAKARHLPLGRTAARALARLPTASMSVEYAARFALASSAPTRFEAYMKLCTYSDSPERARVLDVTEAEVADDIVFQSHRDRFSAFPQQWSLLRQFRSLDLAIYTPGLGLAYADRSGMSEGVEIRVPFLDLDLVRWSLRLPDAALVRGRQGKLLPKEMARQTLPSEVVARPKRGFAAPSHLLPVASRVGGRGFRQTKYFDSAAAITRLLLQSRTGPDELSF